MLFYDVTFCTVKQNGFQYRFKYPWKVKKVCFPTGGNKSQGDSVHSCFSFQSLKPLFWAPYALPNICHKISVHTSLPHIQTQPQKTYFCVFKSTCWLMPISLSLNKLKISLHLVCQACSFANPFPFCQEHAVVLQRNVSQNVLHLFPKWKASFRNRSSEYIKNVTLHLRAAALSRVRHTGYSWGCVGRWRTLGQQSPSGTVRNAEGLIHEMPGDDNPPLQSAYGTWFPWIAVFPKHLKRSWNCGNFVIPLNLGTAAHSPVTELTAHDVEPLHLTMLRCFMIFINFSLHVFWFSPSHGTVW